jgi:hypothetical protein
MPKEKTQHCDKCRNFGVIPYLGIGPTQYRAQCMQGHGLRFYKPKTERDAYWGDWGWKRRCEDFDRGVICEHGHSGGPMRSAKRSAPESA